MLNTIIARNGFFLTTKNKNMTKQILNVAIVAAVLAAMCGTAYARIIPDSPDAGSTSALLLLAAVGLGVVRKFLR